MAGFFADDWLDQLRARTDLVQLVGSYVPLTQKNRRFWGCCPFHSEKTPSFTVDPEKQFYYCFGCHAGGNAIHFVMNMEKLEFRAAVELLAERAGLALPDTKTDEAFEQRKRQKDRAYEALKEAARYYHQTLLGEEGEQARAYLAARGITPAQAKRFGLGAAPKGWQGLSDHLAAKGFSPQALVDGGLISEKNGRTFDFFRHKLMFPIIDQRGRVLGFGGRLLEGEGPKYVNTPDTLVYNKRQMLYGLNFYRSFGVSRELILVEGYMDLIALSTAGFPNVVASLGTALTSEQCRLMRRFADTVFVAYDGDTAGRTATLRGLDLLEQEGLNVRVWMMPQGLDPDDVVRKQGKKAVDQLNKDAQTLTQFKITLLFDQHKADGEDGRMAFATQATALIRDLSPVEKERYVRHIATLSGYSYDTLLEQSGLELPQVQKPRPRPAATKPKPEAIAPLQARMIALMATDHRIRARAFLSLTEQDFDEALHRALFAQMMTLLDDDCTAQLLSRLTEAAQAAAATALFADVEPATDDMVEDYLDRLIIHRLERELQALTAQTKTEGADLRALTQDIAARTREINRLKHRRTGGS